MSIIHDGSSTTSQSFADRVRLVTTDQPFRWLGSGWRDFLAAPGASLCYGLLFVIIGFALTVGLWHTQAAYLLLPFASGFMLLGPALTIGLQAISRDLERGEHPSFRSALLAWRANAGPIFHAGLALMCLFLFWLRLVQIIFAVTLLDPTGLDVQSLLNETLFTINGLAFVTLFVALGAAVAALVFAGGAFALPMLLDRPIGMYEAFATSFWAVKLNLPAMAVWATMLVVLTVAGMATCFIGLVVTLPLAGHATWHAYRAVIRPQEE